MKKHHATITLLVSVILIALPQRMHSQDHKKGRVQVTVIGGNPSAPVKGADVMVSSGSGDFHERDQTSSRGVVTLTNVPQGTLVVQIAAPGWKTSGSQHVLSTDRLTITITLEKVAAPPPSPSPSASPTATGS